MPLTRSLSPRHILTLEIIAFVAMVIDHLSRAGIFPVPYWEIIGRLAFPLFVITFARNATRYQRCNIPKLIIIGLLAQPAAAALTNVHWWQPNVMFAFPLGWLVFRFFADPLPKNRTFLKPVALCFAVAALSLGAAYDVRGIALIATALGAFSCASPAHRITLATLSYFYFTSTLFATPEKIVPVTVLLVLVIGFTALVPPGQIVHSRATWWHRAGFGKWYVIHAYVIYALKALPAITA